MLRCRPAHMHRDLLDALAPARGLVIVASPTGHGKTTTIERALADSACPPGVFFAGDIRGDVAPARQAVSLSRSRTVVAVLRIPRAAGAFRRFLDLGVPAVELVEVVRVVFSTRLARPTDVRADFVLLGEKLLVTHEIRALIHSGADPDAIHRQAIAQGMQSLRQAGLAQVSAGRLDLEEVAYLTPDDEGPLADPWPIPRGSEPPRWPPAPRHQGGFDPDHATSRTALRCSKPMRARVSRSLRRQGVVLDVGHQGA